jgi:hypothetical protein
MSPSTKTALGNQNMASGRLLYPKKTELDICQVNSERASPSSRRISLHNSVPALYFRTW